jgi:3-methyladenine DNA glycosylase AlkD
MSKVLTLCSELDTQFRKQANSLKAEEMSNYMKSKFAFLGLPSPLRKEIQSDWFIKLLDLTGEEKRELVQELWQKEEREFQYTAIDFIKKWKKKEWLEEDLDFLKWLITQKSWWDTVDLIASNYLGNYFLLFPHKLEAAIENWRNSENIWLNRSTLIYQLKYKNQVNFELLKSLVVQFQANKEFFIQKAIGWSLRSYADVYPEKVMEFVNEINLEGLAKREAIRKIA